MNHLSIFIFSLWLTYSSHACHHFDELKTKRELTQFLGNYKEELKSGNISNASLERFKYFLDIYPEDMDLKLQYINLFNPETFFIPNVLNSCEDIMNFTADTIVARNCKDHKESVYTHFLYALHVLLGRTDLTYKRKLFEMGKIISNPKKYLQDNNFFHLKNDYQIKNYIKQYLLEEVKPILKLILKQGSPKIFDAILEVQRGILCQSHLSQDAYSSYVSELYNDPEVRSTNFLKFLYLLYGKNFTGDFKEILESLKPIIEGTSEDSDLYCGYFYLEEFGFLYLKGGDYKMALSLLEKRLVSNFDLQTLENITGLNILLVNYEEVMKNTEEVLKCESSLFTTTGWKKSKFKELYKILLQKTDRHEKLNQILLEEQKIVLKNTIERTIQNRKFIENRKEKLLNNLPNPSFV